LSDRIETRPIRHEVADHNKFEPARSRNVVGEGNLRRATNAPPPARERVRTADAATVDRANAADIAARKAYSMLIVGRDRLVSLYTDFPDTMPGLQQRKDTAAAAVTQQKANAVKAARVSVALWKRCNSSEKLAQARALLDQVTAMPVVPAPARIATVTDGAVKQLLGQLHNTPYSNIADLNRDVGKVRDLAIKNLTAWRHASGTAANKDRAEINAGLERARNYISNLNEFEAMTAARLASSR
jgi:hypothetical protein